MLPSGRTRLQAKAYMKAVKSLWILAMAFLLTSCGLIRLASLPVRITTEVLEGTYELTKDVTKGLLGRNGEESGGYQ